VPVIKLLYFATNYTIIACQFPLHYVVVNPHIKIEFESHVTDIYCCSLKKSLDQIPVGVTSGCESNTTCSEVDVSTFCLYKIFFVHQVLFNGKI